MPAGMSSSGEEGRARGAGLKSVGASVVRGWRGALTRLGEAEGLLLTAPHQGQPGMGGGLLSRHG